MVYHRLESCMVAIGIAVVSLFFRGNIGFANSPVLQSGSLASDDSAELKETVRLSWTANDDRLGAVKVKVRTTFEQILVEEKATAPVLTKGDLQFNFGNSRETTARYTISLFGKTMRCDVVGEDLSVIQQYGFDGVRWTEYDPARQTAELRRPDQMPGILPLDPREVASYLNLVTMDSILQSAKVSREVPFDVEGIPSLKKSAVDGVWLFHETEGNQIFLVQCDPAMSFLPVLSLLCSSDRILIRQAEVSYQRAGSTGALILDKAASTFFVESEGDLIRSSVYRTYLDEIQSIPDDQVTAELTVKLPDDPSRVHDHISGFRDQPVVHEAPASEFPLFIAINGVALLVLFVLGWRKRSQLNSAK